MQEEQMGTRGYTETGHFEMHQQLIFQNVVTHLFYMAGYEIQQEIKIDHVDFDVVATGEGRSCAIEVKYLTSSPIKTLYFITRSIQRLVENAKKCSFLPVLVISAQIRDELRKRYTEEYPDLIILDTSNLLFIAGNDQKTYDEIVSVLPNVIDNIEPIEPDSRINLSWLKHEDEYETIVKGINACPAGNEKATQFEDLCYDALRYSLSNDLTVWKRQIRANDGLFRFDLICRIKDGNQKTFWKTMEQFFHSKYIIFEFKNYDKEITQEQIFTTEKYLYRKALRTVGIIIAANGAHVNARKAAKGVFRETGKLIMLLDKYELIQMCELRRKEDDPSNFLMDKLDQLLFEMEK